MADHRRESEELVSTVGHMLGFRIGSGGKLLPNENLTKGQGRGTSTSNLESIVINKKLGTGPAQWETGALLKVASDLELVENEVELERLKRKFESGGDGSKTGQVNSSAMKQKPEEASDNHDRRSFHPPARVPADVVSNGYDHNQSSRNVNGIQNKVSPQLNQRNQSVMSSWKPTSSSGLPSLFNTVKNTAGSPTLFETKTNREAEVTRSPNYRQTPSVNSTLAANNPFKSAYDQLKLDDKAKGIERSLPRGDVHVSGLRRPRPNKCEPQPAQKEEPKPKYSDNPEVEEIMSHESMSNIDPKMVEAILNEVVQTTSTNWDDIAGLEGVKDIIREVIIWPLRRPDIFTGLRAAPKGILFFGPPGTGKTMFGRVIANQFQSTFFNISASSLTSKWIGDGEKMVRALFAVARLKQPSVIFIDEIDSILTQRSDTEHESSRRLKTEFLIQFDGCATQSEEKMLVIGVTNRPQELDEAARRRFVKRVYIPLPDFEGRKQLVRNLLKKYSASLSEEDYNEIAKMTEGYSGADMNSLCREAAYGPIREIGHMLDSIDADSVRPMQMKDFVSAQRQVKSSVATSDVTLYQEWDSKFGCHI